MKKIAFLILILTAVFGFSQSDTLQVKVKGKIIDIKTNMPIARVTVLNKNTSAVVLASENGDFEIFAKTNDKLLFSHLGYNYAEVGVNQKSYLQAQSEIYKLIDKNSKEIEQYQKNMGRIEQMLLKRKVKRELDVPKQQMRAETAKRMMEKNRVPDPKKK